MEIHWRLIHMALGIALILSPTQSNEFGMAFKPEPKCNKLLHNYTEQHMEFQACAIKHAEPVTYCTNCIEHIIGETIAYRNFTGDDTCRAIYVDSDRLNIIETTYENSKNLWNAGSCAECFNCNINDNPANCTQTNTTIEFLTLTVAWMNCTANTNKNTCLDCKDDYENINIMYDQMRRKRGEKICFDLEDSMNKTRIKWSKKYHCCEDRNSSLIYFFSVASGFGIIVAVFYLSVFVWGKHTEHADYESIDDDARAVPETPNRVTTDDDDFYQAGHSSNNLFM